MALQDRTEPATARKRDEAREDGKVAKSADMISALVLIASLLILRVAGPYLMEGITGVFRSSLSELHRHELTIDSLPALASSCAILSGRLCLPIAFSIAAVDLWPTCCR